MQACRRVLPGALASNCEADLAKGVASTSPSACIVAHTWPGFTLDSGDAGDLLPESVTGVAGCGAGSGTAAEWQRWNSRARGALGVEMEPLQWELTTQRERRRER